MTIIDNIIANAPNMILLILVDNFLIYGKKLIDTLSIPTTSNVSESRNTRNSIPNPGFAITIIERAMAINPTIICKILIPLESPVSDAVFIERTISLIKCYLKSYLIFYIKY